uniref:Uncharacterized protein n=1 Tax=viral metagenome TaxID=1070528 RepID=A0A6M3INV6_9ZZZZ
MPIAFYGKPYTNVNTATDDTGRRFETSEKKLIHAIIEVETHGQTFGTADAYTYLYYGADSKFELYNFDLSSLYFANKTAGQNGVVSILGILAEG